MSWSESSIRKSIAEHFEELPDPRSEGNHEHLLVDVIVNSIGAFLAGADGPTAIAMWAKSPSVTDFFADHLDEDFARVKVRRLETTETHHGRVEKRSYFPVNVPDDWKGRSRVKGLRTLGLMIRTREIHGVETAEIPCSISRRTVDAPSRRIRQGCYLARTGSTPSGPHR